MGYEIATRLKDATIFPTLQDAENFARYYDEELEPYKVQGGPEARIRVYEGVMLSGWVRVEEEP
jgi:hypothetical protein